MKATVEDISSIKKKIEVIIPHNRVTKDLDDAYSVLSKQARIKGFRPGKAPRSILERMYKEDIENEVINNLINDAYPKALEEQDLHPVGMPVLEKGKLSRDKDFIFSATVDVAPKIEPRDYTGMELEKEKIELTDERVDSQLENIRSAHAQLEAIEEDRPLQEGDAAIINYQGFRDDQPLDEVKNDNFPVVLGLGRFNKDLEDALIGVSKGESKDIDVTFPEDFDNPEVAGKIIRFKVEVVDIKKRTVPELDDEFAKDLGAEFETLEDLRQKIKEQIENSEEQRIRNKLYNDIRKKLVESHTFEVPGSLVDYQIQRMMDNAEQNVRRQGLTFETAGIVPEKLAEDFRAPAEENVRSALILESIAEKEGLEIGDSEIDEELEKIAFQIGQSKEVIEKFYRENNMIDNLTQQLLEQKTLKFIEGSATIKEVENASKTDE